MTVPSFWSRSWRALDAARLADYAARFDPSPDALTEELHRRGARTVCDAGCGCGLFTLKLARQGFAVSGFDLAAEAVELAEALLRDEACPAELRTADVCATGYADGQFDAVAARDVLDHLPLRAAREALAELLRIVRPGGCVLLTLDGTDEEYETAPHEVTADGDYRFTEGKWRGMTFHPYTRHEVERLTAGHRWRMLAERGDGYAVCVEKA